MKKRIVMLLVFVFCVGATAVFADTDTENITVMSDGKVLEKNVDYILTYKNNVNPGMATVTVNFIGNYSGTMEKTFEIVRQKRTSTGGTRSRGKSHVIVVEPAAEYDPPYIFGYENNTFRPEAEITRAEAATAIARAIGLEPQNGDSRFLDISAHWAKGYINAAAALNIVNGYEDGSFRPDENITRAEFAKMIARLTEKEIAKKAALFFDVKNHWAELYIAALAEKGIVTGYVDGTFRPETPITRAEAVTIVNRAVTRNCAPNLTVQFRDVSAGHWAYEDILKAAGTADGK